MNELKLKNDYKRIDKKVIEKIEGIVKDGSIKDPKNKDVIKEYMEAIDYDYCNCIGDFIASMFGVDRSDMLSFDKRENVVRARWMWWMTLHFIFNFSYRNIIITSYLDGAVADESSIYHGISKIQEEMKNNSLLSKKWDIIKQMTSAGNDEELEANKKNDIKITIYKDKGSNVKVDFIDTI